MGDLQLAAITGFLILAASVLSVELGISVAIIEILLGVLGGSLLGPWGVHATPWIDFLAGFGGIVLTFLAGAELTPTSSKAIGKGIFSSEVFRSSDHSWLAPPWRTTW